MKKTPSLDWASWSLDRALGRLLLRSGVAMKEDCRNPECKAETRLSPGDSFMNCIGSPLFVLLLVGASLAGPRLLLADTPHFVNLTDRNPIAQSGSFTMDGGLLQDESLRPNSKLDKTSRQSNNPDPRPLHPIRPVRPSSNYPPGHSSPRPPAHHHPHYGPAWPNYAWGSGNYWRLHRFFMGDRHPIDSWHRHHFYPGPYFPRLHANRIQPIPPSLMMYLPPVPPGFAVGYYDGYCLLYDPFTFRIVSVVDLYRY